MNGEASEREGDAEFRLQALSCQHRARHGARTHRLGDHDLSRSRTLNRLSHLGTPQIHFKSEQKGMWRGRGRSGGAVILYFPVFFILLSYNTCSWFDTAQKTQAEGSLCKRIICGEDENAVINITRSKAAYGTWNPITLDLPHIPG